MRLSADYLWMAPAANLGFALLAVGLVGLLGRIQRSWGATPVVLGVLTALLVMSTAFYVESLHRGAVLLLAAGVGSQTARLAGMPRARKLYRIVPLTALGLAAVMLFASVSLRLGQSRREATAIGGLPQGPAGGPNLLLLILDTVREQSSGLGGRDSTTAPALDAFARRGVVFERAIAPAPWTLPSHASFFTGQQPTHLSANWGIPLDRVTPTLAEYLASKGYVTAGFVGNLQFATRASGLARGFLHYDDFQSSLGQILVSSSIGRALAGATWLRRLVGYHELLNRRHAADVTDDFLDWEAKPRGRPFFAFINFFDAHEPYFPPGRSGSVLAPSPRWTRYEHVIGLNSGANAWIAEKWTLTREEIAVHASAYAGAVSIVEAQAGRLLSELDRRGVLSNTVVIITADHGEQLGEHQMFEHINSLYLPSLHVPLLIVAPGAPPGGRVKEAVGLRDLPATIVDLLGIADGAPFPGRSLTRHWTGPAGSDTVLSMLRRGLVRQGWYPIGRGAEMFSLTTTQHHLIRNGDGSEELYDLRIDPGELKNLAGDSGSGEVLRRLSGALSAVVPRRVTAPSATSAPP